MRRDDRDDPFDEFFREIERMMDEMTGAPGEMDETGFGSDIHVDVHEFEEEVRVVADLPGLEKEDIGLQCDGETLTIAAASDTREYEDRITLPARVDERSAAATYNNGVLEVTFDRAQDSRDIAFE